MWKSDLTDKIKRIFSKQMDALHRRQQNVWKKAWRQLHKNAASHIEQVLEAITHKIVAVRPPTAHYENYQS